MHAIRKATGAVALAAVLALGVTSAAKADLIYEFLYNSETGDSTSASLSKDLSSDPGSDGTLLPATGAAISDPPDKTIIKVDRTFEGNTGTLLEDSYEFTIDDTANAQPAAANTNFTGGPEVQNITLSLFEDTGGGFNLIGTGFGVTDVAFNAFGLTAGATYLITIVATTLLDPASYDLTVVLNPIPIPGALLLLFSGIMVLFGAGKARRRTAGAAA